MTILFWNVRGMNKKSRRKDIKNHIRSIQPTVMGLIETKVKSHKASRITNCIPPNWSYYNNYANSAKGRIWIAWEDAVWTGSVISISLQQISIQLENKGGLIILITLGYGENKEIDRKQLWADIRDIHDKSLPHPLLIIGDFNICRYSSEKIGGNLLSITKLQDFNDCINYCGLADVKSIGNTWSWHNNQDGSARIYGKLDSGLCNTLWQNVLAQAFIEYRGTSSSDHTPLILHLKDTSHQGPKPFRYFNH